MNTEKRRYTDLSIDLETLGTRPGSVITQIGLCSFDAAAKEDADGEKFLYCSTLIPVDPQSCLDAGLSVDWDTVAWWLGQSSDARGSLLAKSETSCSLSTALHLVSEWVRDTCLEDEYSVWGYPNSFDVTLLEEAMRRCKVPVPWSFRKVRDLRTLAKMTPAGDRPTVVGIAHDAECDAVAQAKWTWICHAELRARNAV